MITLELKTGIVKKGDLYGDDLYELLRDLDTDLVGDNGLEFVSDEAKDKGFESELDYYIHLAESKSGNREHVIEDVLTRASNYWKNYYQDTEFSICEIQEGYMVSIAVCS